MQSLKMFSQSSIFCIQASPLKVSRTSKNSTSSCRPRHQLASLWYDTLYPKHNIHLQAERQKDSKTESNPSQTSRTDSKHGRSMDMQHSDVSTSGLGQPPLYDIIICCSQGIYFGMATFVDISSIISSSLHFRYHPHSFTCHLLRSCLSQLGLLGFPLTCCMSLCTLRRLYSTFLQNQDQMDNVFYSFFI